MGVRGASARRSDREREREKARDGKEQEREEREEIETKESERVSGLQSSGVARTDDEISTDRRSRGLFRQEEREMNTLGVVD